MKKFYINEKLKISEKELLRIKKKFARLPIPHTKENLLKQEYKVRVKDSFRSFVLYMLSLLQFGAAVFFALISIKIVAVVLLVLSVIFALTAFIGKRMNFNEVYATADQFAHTADTLAVITDTVSSAFDLIGIIASFIDF